MSALTVLLFCVSVLVFLVLLATAMYFMLLNWHQSHNPELEPFPLPSSILAPLFSCEVEVVALDQHMQITNLEEPQIRMNGTGLGRGLRLVPEDQLKLKFQPGVNQYRFYSIEEEEDGDDNHFLMIRVASDFIEIKPVLKHIRSRRRIEIVIWKMRPYTVKSEAHLAERQVFSGYLQKTVHFSRAPGKYFRFLVTTSGPQNRLESFIQQSNVQSQIKKHRLLTLKVEPGRVSAVNQSNLPMHVAIKYRSETLKRRLNQDMRELPANGTFSFTLMRTGHGIQKPRKALRLHLSDKQILVEPHSKFGSLPLSCDVYLPDPYGDAPNQIVSGEFLSPLQLPRASNRYVIAFFMHMKPGSNIGSSSSGRHRRPAYSK